jgi:hypothetical protein
MGAGASTGPGRLALCDACVELFPADERYCPSCGQDRRPQLPGAFPGVVEGRAQSRAERIALLTDALTSVDRPAVQTSLTFRGNEASSGISGCWIHVDQQPGARVRVLVVPELRNPDGDAFRGRLEAMRAAGWPDDGSRSWELAPADEAAVGTIVDAIQVVLDASRVPALVEWHVRSWKEKDRKPGEAPADEPWVEDATERAVRQRLARLARMRGGRVLVRFAGPSAVIALAARRRRGAIVVDAECLVDEGAGGPPWSERWTVPEDGAGATPLVDELEDALRLLSPPGSGGRLAVRLEQHEAAQAHAQSYAFFAGWLVAAIPFALLAFALAGPGSTGLLAVFADLHADTENLGAWLVIVAVGLSALVVGAVAAVGADAAAAWLRWRYEATETLEAVVAAIAGLAYLGVVVAVGDAWVAVAAAPWILAIGIPVASGVMGLLRPGG